MAEAASPPSPRSSRAPDLGSITEDKAANPAALERAETRRPQWRLAQHTVTVNRNTGERTAMEALSALVQKRSMSVTSVGAQEQGSGGPRSRARRATVTADPKSLANTFLTHMEIFHKANFVWHPTNYFQSNYQAVLGLFKEVTMIFAREPRCVHVPAPAYVMGDLHGNFQDLCTFGHAFWNQGAAVCPANLVFLGDYVDRRNFSIEVVVYLFAQKLAYPQKVVLLRGNHETRNVNMSFGLLAECQAKFGPNAELVWEELNKAFDHLPLAAVVGESVFCCHGGIPGPECTGEISEINRIPCPLANEDDNILARDLLWSDPAETDGVQDFEPNVDRGVSHKFSSRALEKFLNRNNLDFVIRAHQFKVHLGFQVQKKGRLVTVFSSSGYCGQKNEASCVLVADGKLRMMRLDSIADRMDGPMPVVPGTNFVTQPAAQ